MPTPTRFCLVPLLAVAFALTACVPGPDKHAPSFFTDLPEPTEPHDDNIIRATELAVDQMMTTARELLEREDRILVATFVDANAFQLTSNFGRFSRDVVEGRLASMGFRPRVITLRRDTISVTPEGEFVLTRDPARIAGQHEAEAIVVGRYNVAGSGVNKTVYCHLRILRAADGAVIGSHDYDLPVGPRTASLLRGGTEARAD